MSTPTTSTTASAVSVKPPKWDSENSTAWFAVMEAQFILAGITIASTKFYHVLASLPPHVIGKLDTTIIEGASYTDLKTAVIKEMEKSKPELFQQLLESVPVGKPSHYIRDMKKTADTLNLKDCDELLKHRLIESQPSEVAAVLMSQSAHLSPYQLGELADQMLTLRPRPTLRPNEMVANVNTTKPAETTTKHKGLIPFRPNQRQVICRAHVFYGQNARTCRRWCQWPSNKPKMQSNQSSREPSPTPEN